MELKPTGQRLEGPVFQFNVRLGSALPELTHPEIKRSSPARAVTGNIRQGRRRVENTQTVKGAR